MSLDELMAEGTPQEETQETTQDTSNPSEVAPAAPEAPKAADPLDKIVNDLVDTIREKAFEKVRKEVGKDEADRLTAEDGNLNETIIKSALRHSSWRRIARVVLSQTKKSSKARKIVLGMVLYKTGGWRLVKSASQLDGVDRLIVSRMVDLVSGRRVVAGENRLYRTILAVGGPSDYLDVGEFLSACRRKIGRPLTADEAKILVTKGRVFEAGS
jgi:hypothetical protein